MKRRVVITGLGAVTPIGNTVEEFWNGVREGACGIGTITKFDTAEYKVHLAGEVKGFVAKERMDFKAARRMGTFSQYAVAAAKEAFADAGISMENEDPFRVGVLVGSGVGDLNACEQAKAKIDAGNPSRVNPEGAFRGRKSLSALTNRGLWGILFLIPHILRRSKSMTIYDELVARGLIAQVTNESEIKEMINNGKATFYIGFDCTADSLTAGHFMALTLMKRLQMAGNKPVALIGGGTTMIGDPSGRTDMRKMLTREDINHNAECFKRQMERFIDFGPGKAIMVNNADWLMNLNYIDLLREVGACFSVNNMLRAECYKQRMEKGLSFLEFNYMIMQSYDFYYLFQHYGCNMQFGGDDQWSNMLGGTELIRRKLGKDAHAMTITLLTDSQGKKMGKTAGNAVWLDPNKTSPYEFYQYWRNVGDADVMKCIRMLTFLPIEQIEEMKDWKDAKLNEAKEILAFELTKLVHGEEEAAKAQAQARALFGSGSDAEAPVVELTADDFMNGTIDLPGILVKCGMVKSKSEGRTAIQQGGVTVDDEKVTDVRTVYTPDDLKDGKLIRKGKKNFKKVVSK